MVEAGCSFSRVTHTSPLDPQYPLGASETKQKAESSGRDPGLELPQAGLQKKVFSSIKRKYLKILSIITGYTLRKAFAYGENCPVEALRIPRQVGCADIHKQALRSVLRSGLSCQADPPVVCSALKY